jgi:hypothetical protein
MSLQNAIENLQELAETLEVQPPILDEDSSCCLECSDGLIVNFIYDDASDALYIYLPLLEGLPKEAEEKADLYERILECSLKWGKAQSGTIGVDLDNDRLMYYDSIDVSEPGRDLLVSILPSFMDMAGFWKEVIARVA